MGRRGRAASQSELDFPAGGAQPANINDFPAGTGLAGHTFNQFFPWQINEDGTAEETINHIGRHEIGGSYCSASEGVCRFGLGSAAQAEGVEVRWSSGQREPVGTVKADQVVTVREGHGIVRA